MLQQTPLAVTGEPPSLVILPPLVAVVVVIFNSSAVVITGAKARVLKDKTLL